MDITILVHALGLGTEGQRGLNYPRWYSPRCTAKHVGDTILCKGPLSVWIIKSLWLLFNQYWMSFIQD